MPANKITQARHKRLTNLKKKGIVDGVPKKGSVIDNTMVRANKLWDNLRKRVTDDPEFVKLTDSEKIDISTARFANVAFSNGSLLEGFKYRIENQQPFSAPSDIRRYFVVKQEAGVLCMLSALLGETNDIFFLKMT